MWSSRLSVKYRQPRLPLSGVVAGKYQRTYPLNCVICVRAVVAERRSWRDRFRFVVAIKVRQQSLALEIVLDVLPRATREAAHINAITLARVVFDLERRLAIIMRGTASHAIPATPASAERLGDCAGVHHGARHPLLD